MKLAWRAAVTGLAVVAVGLVAAYSATVPAFEAPDEPGHFHYVQELAGGRGLPVQGQQGTYDPEFSQPPLYYLLETPVARLLPAQGAALPGWEQHNNFQNATAEGNANLYAHYAGEAFPWTGQVLQLHVMRLLNLLLAGVSVLATYGIGRQVGLSRWLALAAAASLALLPQFAFIAGALNADNGITATAAITLYLLLRWLNGPTWRGAGLLGLATGAALLSKLSGLAAIAVVVAAMAWGARRSREASAVGQAGLAAATALAIGGWWYARNAALFGDILGWQPMLTAIGAMLRPAALDPLTATATLLRQWHTAIGVFGWNNVRLGNGVYGVAAGLAGCSALGLIIGNWRTLRRRQTAVRAGSTLMAGGAGVWRPAAATEAGERLGLPELLSRHTNMEPRYQWLLACWAGVFAISLVRWVAVNTDGAQWRLLFPAFPALAVLFAGGLSHVHRWLPAAAPVGFAALSAASLLFVIRPAYTPAPPYSGAMQHEVDARFGDALELVGYDDPHPEDVDPGGQVELTLYWRALRRLALDDVVHLAALDAGGRPGLEQSTWPQDGRAPTSDWQPGVIVRDRHLIGGTAALSPGVYRLLLDVYQPLEGAPRLTVSGGSTLAVGRFLIRPPRIASQANPTASFGGALALLGEAHTVESGKLLVTLDWQIERRLDRDYTIFVHLLDAAGRVASQSDSQPDGGRFPTSLLPAGLRIRDRHTLPLDRVGEGYRLEIGAYDPETGGRLKLTGSSQDALELPVKLGR